MIRRLKAQLGSIRGVYLANTTVRRRDDFGDGREVVLLLHGLMQTRRVWEVLEERLRDHNYAVMSFHLAGLAGRFNTHPVETTAGFVAEKLDRLRAKHGFGRVHLVGHSMGGLIAREYIQHLGGAAHVRSLVTLGTPHRGTPMAALGVAVLGFGLLPTAAAELLPGSRLMRKLRAPVPSDLPFRSIYSRGDLLCPSWSARVPDDPRRPLHDAVEVPHMGHTQLTWDVRTWRPLLEGLQRGGEELRQGT